MIERFRLFLGPARVRAFLLLLGITGLLSLMLSAVAPQAEWTAGAQIALALIFFVGAGVIIGGRMTREERARWFSILGPAVGALVLALTVLPNLALPLAGVAVGWLIAGFMLFRPRAPRAYMDAIKHLRRGEYEASVECMNEVIKTEPDNPDYYRFRAEVFRLWGKLDRARRDYQRMAELDGDSAVAFNGLAEVHLQSGKYADARAAALKAYALAPEEWVAAYNLGMIEDRLRDAEAAVTHLTAALALKVPDARHRLLIHLYLARAYARLGRTEAAADEVALLVKHRSGLQEWQSLLAAGDIDAGALAQDDPV
jgi:tetratricopeptide (TPR) repeat protein